ncbi:lysine-sensitive aspartokinase 3, partial [Candidatus Peregrinibacteria bacterium]|nr:lysine-sensitive aspartokinase 3 [Candidatus Peregrinibacteria bacterium]
MIAAKFGGTSMGTPESIGQVADIVEKMAGNRAIIVSATSGTTDKLIALGKMALNGEEWEGELSAMVSRHDEIIQGLGINLDLSTYWGDLRKLLQGISLIAELSLAANDRLQTFGERVSSEILAELLRSRGHKSEAFDAYNSVFTDNNFGEGNVDFERSNRAIRDQIGGFAEAGGIPVITGFVGQSENGHYITLGRGGSDYTGAIVAAALDAGELQIWTDVEGIFNTDPRLVPEAKPLPQLSFNEAGELAFFGAKVLHPKTIKPAIEKNIPVRILNTFNPEAPGSLISNEVEESVKSVTYRKGVSIVNVCSAGMLEARGFLARLFEVFKRHDISVDVVSTSEVSVSLTVDNGHAEEVMEELSEFARVDVQNGMAIVCLVGEGIKGDSGVLGRLFGCLKEHNVSMVSQGASKRNVTFLVSEADAPEVVKKVYAEFFGQYPG